MLTKVTSEFDKAVAKSIARHGSKPFAASIIEDDNPFGSADDEKDTEELFKKGVNYDPKSDNEAMEKVIAESSDDGSKSDGS